jgi:outer membrane protein OmpA-like peptidoglycan-associated protein
LIENGIAADRIEIKAWGGKKPLFDKHSVNAKRNVRVEVEILSE